MSKIFILGVGAQKGGTAWLHQYLTSFANVDAGPLKEYHVWDAISVPENRIYKVSEHSVTQPRDKLRLHLQSSTENYFDYFCQILTRPGVNVTMDITPSYCALKSETLEQIRAGFTARSIKVKVIFVMRDPVDRCWSAVRMNRRKKWQYMKYLIYPQELNLRRSIRTPNFQLRTRYHNTIKELEKVFDEEDIFYGIFETLFDQASIMELSNFIGVTPSYHQASMRINVGDKGRPLGEKTERHVAEYYKDVYRYCGEKFPCTVRLWRGNHFLDFAS